MQCCENVLLLTYSTKLTIFIAYLEYHFGILLYNNVDLCPERPFPQGTGEYKQAASQLDYG